MYYELYVDSLLLVNFVMNLYLLLLVNRSMFRTATRKRILLGAALGALPVCLSLPGIGPLRLKMMLGSILGSIVMIAVTFRVRNIRAFLKVAERLFLYAILMGGTMLLLFKKIPRLEERLLGVWGILGLGAFLYLLLGYFTERRGQQQEYLCKTMLIAGGNRVGLTALVDSGNSLVEPISGKPVSIVEKDIVTCLWKEEPCLYRAIPYHSIGKARGILKGYLLPELQIELDGVIKRCKNTYVAVCEEYITSGEETGEGHVKMILNPLLLEEQYANERAVHERREKAKRRTSKERYGSNYDIKSGSPG